MMRNDDRAEPLPLRREASRVHIRECTPRDFDGILPLLRELWPDKPIDSNPLCAAYDRGLKSDSQACICAVNGSQGTFCTLPRELSSRRQTPPIVGEEWIAVRGTVDDHVHIDHVSFANIALAQKIVDVHLSDRKDLERFRTSTKMVTHLNELGKADSHRVRSAACRRSPPALPATC